MEAITNRKNNTNKFIQRLICVDVIFLNLFLGDLIVLVLQHIQSCLKHIISVVSFQRLLYFHVPRHKMLNRGLRTKDTRPVP